jgi:hypothetical protein
MEREDTVLDTVKHISLWNVACENASIQVISPSQLSAKLRFFFFFRCSFVLEQTLVYDTCSHGKKRRENKMASSANKRTHTHAHSGIHRKKGKE